MRGIAIIIFSCLVMSGWSQMYNPVHWTTSLKDNGDGTYSFVASAKIDEGWWVYSQFLPSEDGPIATTVNFDEGTHYKLMGKSKESDNAIKMYDKIFEMDVVKFKHSYTCLLYTSDAADERSSVDLGGRRIIKKKNVGNSVNR